jgi:hypothetical protein
MHREVTSSPTQTSENTTHKKLLKPKIGFVFPLTPGTRLSIISLSSRVYGTIARQGEASLERRSAAEIERGRGGEQEAIERQAG